MSTPTFQVNLQSVPQTLLWLSVLFLVCPSVQGAGELTMWTTSSTAVTGSSCEFASSTATGSGSSPWLDLYVNAGNTGMYCAVSDDLYANGVGCGKCYTVSYNAADPNTEGTTTSGSATIQVVDSGAGGTEHFDCYITAFQAIAGASTGVYDIGPTGSYTQVDCDCSGSYVVMLDGNNAFFTKVLFSGGRTGVSGATLRIGASSFTMSKISGATWSANLSGQTNEDVNYDITYADGSTLTINCGSTWPVATSTVCSTSTCVGGAGTSPTSPSGSSTPAPSAAPTCAECFAGESMVDVYNKGPVPMKDIKIGDLVNTGSHVVVAKGGSDDQQAEPLYQPMYAWAHIQPDIVTTFLQIHVNFATTKGLKPTKWPLEISPAHLVFLEGQRNPIRADSIKVGDVLSHGSYTSSSSTAPPPESIIVSKVKRVHRRGMYAPLTKQGTLVVNGIKTSAYISLQHTAPQYIQLQDRIPLKMLSQHDLVHMFLSPFRLICSNTNNLPTRLTDRICHSYNEDGMPHYVDFGLRLAQTMDDDYGDHKGTKKNIGVQILVLLLVVIVMGSFTLLENLLFFLEGVALLEAPSFSSSSYYYYYATTTTTLIVAAAALGLSLFLLFKSTIKLINLIFLIRKKKKVKST